MAQTTTTPGSVPGAEPTSPSRARSFSPGLAGAIAAGLSIGLTELGAGLFPSVASAISSVGGVVVDRSPAWAKDLAISLLGTADKGALAFGTVIISVLLGIAIGRRFRKYPWIGPVAFGGFAVVGIAAALDEPGTNSLATAVVIVLAAAAGLGVLGMLTRDVGEAPTDGVAQDPGRRKIMAAAVGSGVVAVAAGTLGRSLIIRRSEEMRTTRSLPTAASLAPAPAAGASFDVPGIAPIVVPNGEFYRIDTALVVPRVEADSWRMKVTGLVDRPFDIGLDDLLAMPLVERYVTIACVSNEVGGDLVGNAKWTGVPLVELLDRAGVKQGADQIVGRSVDGWTSGFPTALAYDGREPLVAVGMNGELLPQRHGFPARLIVPGLYGYVSATKWLAEVELTTLDGFDAYWIPKGWSKLGPIKTQSRIDYPKWGQQIPGDPLVVAGVAWAPTVGIAAVEIRIDEGEWQQAELSSPLSGDAWVQWKIETQAAPGGHNVEVRATDATGNPQTATRTPPRPNGATGYHNVRFGVV